MPFRGGFCHLITDCTMYLKDFYSTFHFLLIISILFFAFTVEKLNTEGNPWDYRLYQKNEWKQIAE